MSTVTLDTGGSAVAGKNLALEDLLAASSHLQESSLAEKLKFSLSNLQTPVEQSFRKEKAENKDKSFGLSKALIEKSSLNKPLKPLLKNKDLKINAD